jgi:hypothetical protein
MIKAKARDEKIKSALEKLHDIFHKIIGLCSNEDNH